MKTIDYIQKKNGQSKIKLGSQDLKKRWKMKQERLSCLYTTKINDIIKVNINDKAIVDLLLINYKIFIN